MVKDLTRRPRIGPADQLRPVGFRWEVVNFCQRAVYEIKEHVIQGDGILRERIERIGWGWGLDK